MIEFASKACEEKYNEREKLFSDTVALKQTSRVPVTPLIMYLPLTLYGGVTTEDALTDLSLLEGNWLRFYEEYQPDLCWEPGTFVNLPGSEILGCRYYRWPVKDLNDPNAPYQIKEEECMFQDEYKEFVEDPSAFMFRKLMPR